MRKVVTILVLLFALNLMFGQGNQGILILNNLGKTMSFYNPETNSLTQELLVVDSESGNNSPNDFVVVNDTLYVIVSMTDKLNVFDLNRSDNSPQIASVSIQLESGVLANPNKIITNGDKLYITLLTEDALLVLDRKTLTRDTILSVPVAPEGMLIHNDKLYVCATGFNLTTFEYGPSYVYVFDLADYSAVDTISLPTQNIRTVHFLNQNEILIHSAGALGVSGGKLYKYDVNSQAATDSLVTNDYLSDAYYDPYTGQFFVSLWGIFQAYDEGFNQFATVPGGSGFYSTQNNLFTANFEVDSLYVYDHEFNLLNRFATGAGPSVIKPVSLNSVLDINPTAHKLESFELSQNYPNPFNPTTTIDIMLNHPEQVSLKIYNIEGKLIKTLVNEVLPAGVNKIHWNGTDETGKVVSSGVYFYQLRINGKSVTKKMMFVK
ncbi:MAG: hypothetical protein Kow00108_09030 [Calditrichia bacterium]